MIDSLFLLDRKGDLVIFRGYKVQYQQSVILNFRINCLKYRGKRRDGNISKIGCFIYFYREVSSSFTLVAVTRFNYNAICIYESLIQITKLIETRLIPSLYQPIDVILYLHALFDEIFDNGYPQTFDEACLSKLLTFSGFAKPSKDVSVNRNITAQLTGKNSWRQPNIIHKRNEISILVEEKISTNINEKQSSLVKINGRVEVKSKLSGMPSVLIELSEPFQRKEESKSGFRVFYHACVSNSSNSNENSIMFMPPDIIPVNVVKYEIKKEMSVPLIPQVAYQKENEYSGVMYVSLKRMTYLNFIGPVKVIIPYPIVAQTPRVEKSRGKISSKSIHGKLIWKLWNLNEICNLTINLRYHTARTQTETFFLSMEFVMNKSFSGTKVTDVKIKEANMINLGPRTMKYIKDVSLTDKYEYRFNM